MQKELIEHFMMQVDAVKSVSSDEVGKDAWVFEGIASTPDMDLFGEVVYPESFSKSVDFFKNNGKIYFDHEYAKENAEWLKEHDFTKEEILNLKTPLGKPIDAKLTDEGLYIKAVLNKKHPMAKFMWEQYLTNEDENFRGQMGLSIGAKYMGQPKREYDVHKGRYVTYLPELLLYEVSMTPEPVNPHTRTWATVLKSMVESSKTNEIEYHQIIPDSVVYDSNNNTLAIKSTVEGGDGVQHVFEQYINLKEGVSSAMAKEKKVTLKATDDESPEVEIEEAEEVEVSADEAPVDVEESTPEVSAEVEAPEAPEMTGESEALAPDEGTGEDMAELGAADAADEGAGGVLDALVEDEAPGEGMMPEEDASQEMMLDKLDTILDTLMTIAEAMGGSNAEEVPGEGQVSVEAPDITTMKSAILEAIKENTQTVSLSDESSKKFRDTLKSVFDQFSDKLETFEDSIVEKVVHKLQNETTVGSTQKSVSKKEVQIVNPGAAVDAATDNSVDTEVRKSIGDKSEEDVDMDTLKSYIGDYNSIIGPSTAHSQKRAKVIKKATDALGISSNQFRAYVSMSHRGQL